MTTPEPMRSLVSASNLSRRKLCPGSALAEKGLPRLENPYSEEGTLLHHHDAFPLEDKSKLSLEQREILVRNDLLRSKFLDRALPELNIPAAAVPEKIREREFLLLDDDGIPVKSHGQLVPGHPDLIHWYPQQKIAIIFDSKFGRIPVEAAWMNEQLRFYFVVFCDYFPEVERVICAITQPWGGKENDFHSAEYDAADAPAFKKDIIDILRATEDPKAERHPSKEACTYCCAKGECRVAFKPAQELSLVHPDKLTAPELEALWDTMKLVEEVIDGIKLRLRWFVEHEPESVPSMYLKSTGNVRSADPEETFKLLVRQDILKGSTEERIGKFLSMCKFSVTEFEAWIKEDRDLSKSKAQEAVREILGDKLMETPKSKALARKVVGVHERKA